MQSQSNSIQIKTDKAISLTAHAAKPIVCFGDCTTLTATVSGGIGPYAYSWSPTAGLSWPTCYTTTACPPLIGANIYSVTVTDSYGCSASATVTVTMDAPLTVLPTATTYTACFGSSDQLFSNPGGGTGPYTYAWAGAGLSCYTCANPFFNPVNATRTFTVTVTDADGCKATGTVKVTLDHPVITVVTTTGVKCNGGSNGSADVVTITGGTGPYAYSWENAAHSVVSTTNPTGFVLTAGTYTVTVTDFYGCTATHSVTITQPPVLTATAVVLRNLKCNGDCIGQAKVTAGGGTPGYTYNWTPSGGTNATTISTLCAGTYVCTVTDKNGCTVTVSVTITQPPVLTVTATSTATCAGYKEGTATAIVTGGTPTYHYVWSNGKTTSTITALSAGTYTITVTDHNGCTASTTLIVISNPNPTVAITYTPSTTLCSGSPGVTLTATASGGTGPYVYAWAPPIGLTCTNCSTTTANPPTTTTYTVTTTDHNGCTGTSSITVTIDPNCCYAPLATVENTQTLPGGITLWNLPAYNVLGVITIPNTATLNIVGCPSVEMASNAQIIVQPGGKLHIDNSRLWGCPIMWKGIQVQANVANGAGTVDVINASIIDDAITGIEGVAVPTVAPIINVQNSEMNNNYIDIQLDPYAGIYPLTLRTDLFTCQPDGAFSPNAYLKAPYAGDIGYIGVYLDGVSGAGGQTIGDPTLAVYQNTFNNMNYGIYALNTNFLVYNNFFEDINNGLNPWASYPNPVGVAVLAKATSSSSSYSMTVGGCSPVGVSNMTNIVNNCAFGVFATNYRYESVTCNKFWNLQNATALYGTTWVGEAAVYLRPTYSSLLEVSNNDCVNWALGISVVGIPPGLQLASPVNIASNDLYITNSVAAYMSAGIWVEYITGPYTGPLSETNIFSNTVDSSSDCIDVQDIQDNLTNVSGNNVWITPWLTYPHAFDWYTGIHLAYNDFYSAPEKTLVLNNLIQSKGTILTPLPAD